MHLVRRHRRRGGRLECPPVELFAMRTGRDARRRRRDFRCACNSASCRSSAGAISCCAIDRARSAQLPGISFVRRSMDSTTDPPSARSCSKRQLRQSPCRAGRPAAPVPSHALPECGRVRRRAAWHTTAVAPGTPRRPRLLDQVIAVQEAGDVEVRADVLDHHVRRVAPAADRDVAVGKREAFERRRVRTLHHLEAGAHLVGQPGGIEAFTRARSARTRSAIRCLPASERSANCDRSAAALPCRPLTTWRFPGTGRAGCSAIRRAARSRRYPWFRMNSNLLRARKRRATAGRRLDGVRRGLRDG